MPPSRRWLPRALVVALVVGLMLSGYALADTVGPWSDSGDRSTAMSVQVRTIEPTPVDPAEAAAAAKAAEQERKQLRKQRRQQARAEKKAAALKAARQAARKEKRRLARLKSQPYSFTIGSFNVLGSQHTGPRGSRKNFPGAATRTPRAAALARSHGVDILGTQELQEDQYATLAAQTGMKGWPGHAWGAAETDNSIFYDPDVFEFVSGDSYHITFMSRSRPQPILRLRHKETTRELYVVNTHTSAGGGKYATERARAHATTVGVVNQLAATGLPVLLTGDMNDRAPFYCAVVAKTALTASNGGGAGCAPPPGSIPVDWVVGSGVSWSNYRRDTSPVSQRISDHFFISATATVQ